MQKGKPFMWKPFSFVDSLNLEEEFRTESSGIVSTNGGRYDVLVKERKRVPVFWEGKGGPVMRCSWFRRSYSETYPVPYSEQVSEKLEEEYKDAVLTGQWHRQVELPAGERVMLNSPFSMHHYHIQEPTDPQNITAITDSQYPQNVRRGADDFEIKDGDAEQVDHLLFLIHGIGSVCDLRFRTVEECVDDFRTMGEELLTTHFKESLEAGKIGRALHGDQTGLDEKLKYITLRSPYLNFENLPTILCLTFSFTQVQNIVRSNNDVHMHIINTVASEMDRLLDLFRKRNPNFRGDISLGGHSLGSVILFDLLMHQNPECIKSSKSLGENSDSEDMNKDFNESSSRGSSLSLTSQVNFQLGVAGTGQPAIIYPQLSFHPKAFFLMGSPVGMFITVRGIDTLGPTFKLPTCERVFNIFHPFDPVAYRIETLIDTSFSELRPVLIPHHKGRKRMHLELKDTIERVGSDIKNKIVESVQATWNKFYQIYSGSDSDAMRTHVNQAVEEEMQRANPDSHSISEDLYDVKIGQLNRGLRVDYVLQEKPYESFTEYIFALQAHVTYWNSEDTMLMILKELYKINGINSDTQLHQQRRLSEADTLSPSSPTANLLSGQPSITMMSQDNLRSSNAAPVPLFTPPQVDSNLPLPKSSATKEENSRTLRGRPVFDPLKSTIPVGGMDPTAPPSQKNLPPPPTNTKNVNFSRKKT
ncbi:Phospholipase DDHD2 [Armadillidium nasatum]|uniref:Phospholipase DDHD2 n=1 Tax=Armadillidium nasatum TaxID=96803 RepID=A0A5N5SUZ7_9CRUS|nr:Phospholipase DDHD2 [Armadillidium nasatum]